MVQEAPQESKKRSSVNDKLLKIKKIAPIAVGIVVPVVIFSALIVIKLPKAKDYGTTGQQSTGGDGVFSYTEDVPLRYKPDLAERIIYRLFLPKDPQTGEKKKQGYLTKDGIGGVRINQDGSIWIIVIVRDEIYDEYYAEGQEVREDFYAPLKYFKPLSGAGKVPCLKNINLG